MNVAVSPLAEGGVIAERIRGFAVRPQQQQLAAAIFTALQNQESLICEAGTGTGKTFAYLVPVLLSGQKIIISTGTKHLQDQLYHKDLPVVREALKVPVKTALLKGRANYLCLHRLEYNEQLLFDPGRQDNLDLKTIKQWSMQTKSGDLAELSTLSEDSPLRSGLTSTADNCLGQACAFYEDCFVFKARQAANAATLIIVNHHLLLSDLALRETGFGEVLPKADAIIFDEAHQLPDLAYEFFSQTISSRQLATLFNDSEVAYLKDANDMPGVTEQIAALRAGLRKLRLSFGEVSRRIAWFELPASGQVQTILKDFLQRLNVLEQYLNVLAPRASTLENCRRRCHDLMAMLEIFATSAIEKDDLILWMETRGQGFLLHQTPLDIASIFSARIAEYGCNAIYTSATLAVGDNFEHFTDQLGLTNLTARIWPSPFDYKQQALLYLPEGMPEPGQGNYTEVVIAKALPVIHASQGRVFLLFTSHRALQAARRLLTGGIPYPLLVQGEAPRTALLESFRQLGNAVLLGTESFWQGVDVRGQALSCVIIDKLPFNSPGDPVFRARAAKMQAQGNNPFMTYQLPEAVIRLKQGVGRLIRDAEDYGVLMICDPRLLTKPYGKIFIDSLPDMPLTRKAADMVSFFQKI